MALIRKSSRLSRELPNTDYTNFINGKGVDLKVLNTVKSTQGYKLPEQFSEAIIPSQTPSASTSPSVVSGHINAIL